MKNEEGATVPAFVWVAVVCFVAILIFYVVRSKQSVEEVEIPGGFKAKFRAPRPNESVSVTVAYDRESVVLEGQATILIGGAQEARLSVGPGKKYDAARITLPRPGTYSYRVQMSETHKVQEAAGQETAANFPMAGDGQLNVTEGSAFKIVRSIELVAGRAVWHASLDSVGSERRQVTTDGDFQKLERAVGQEQ